MQTHTAESVPVRLHSLTYGETKTYLFAALFIAGNILLPQLCHLAPLGGVRWLPIYFFTLVGACKYGWRVGLLTALLSPLINSALFGMPAAAALPRFWRNRFCWPERPDMPPHASARPRSRCWPQSY